MRTVASELTVPEMQALAQFYGTGSPRRTGGSSTAVTGVATTGEPLLAGR
jgi:hypothetical protein